MSDVLWCVHVIGPDDLYAHTNFDAAQHHANALNAAIRAQEGETPALKEITCRAVVAVWPYSADAHAAAAIRALGDADD